MCRSMRGWRAVLLALASLPCSHARAPTGQDIVTCSSLDATGYTVRTGGMNGHSCADFCAQHDLQCVGAAAPVLPVEPTDWGTCYLGYLWRCDCPLPSGGGYMICECVEGNPCTLRGTCPKDCPNAVAANVCTAGANINTSCADIAAASSCQRLVGDGCQTLGLGHVQQLAPACEQEVHSRGSLAGTSEDSNDSGCHVVRNSARAFSHLAAAAPQVQSGALQDGRCSSVLISSVILLALVQVG
mmetsp:Transcript_66158/g.123471  ORF Transcript_66158/g.123471 Transcript_66158/m.123471 type:complete len:243 (+) Transcript_66158:58-786(+)